MNQQIEDFARHYMWKRRGDKHLFDNGTGHYGTSPHEIQPQEIDYEKARKRAIIFGSKALTDLEMDSFDRYFGVPNTVQTIQEKEKKMYYNQATADIAVMAAPAEKTDAAKEHLLVRISDIYKEKFHDIGVSFEDPHPKNAKESKEWLATGNYRFDIPKGFTDDFIGYGPFQFFNWGKTSPDLAARDAAWNALRKARTDAIDLITVITDEEKRLQALKDFEAATFH